MRSRKFACVVFCITLFRFRPSPFPNAGECTPDRGPGESGDKCGRFFTDFRPLSSGVRRHSRSCRLFCDVSAQTPVMPFCDPAIDGPFVNSVFRGKECGFFTVPAEEGLQTSPHVLCYNGRGRIGGSSRRARSRFRENGNRRRRNGAVWTISISAD